MVQATENTAVCIEILKAEYVNMRKSTVQFEAVVNLPVIQNMPFFFFFFFVIILVVLVVLVGWPGHCCGLDRMHSSLRAGD